MDVSHGEMLASGGRGGGGPLSGWWEQRCRIILMREGRCDVIDISMEVVSSCYFLVSEVGLWVR